MGWLWETFEDLIAIIVFLSITGIVGLFILFVITNASTIFSLVFSIYGLLLFVFLVGLVYATSSVYGGEVG